MYVELGVRERKLSYMCICLKFKDTDVFPPLYESSCLCMLNVCVCVY